ncbi:ImmA/IrrE family metallo-endopeptidase [Nocardia sp. NPDC051570]|uniref:ImmA/IrrE family metallo-endopeptidase n=1 Tax=Nocardia sp. NPDC051570 TaxID=3364324 RepID=UPI00379313C3
MWQASPRSYIPLVTQARLCGRSTIHGSTKPIWSHDQFAPLEETHVREGALLPDYRHIARTHFPGLIVAAVDLPAGSCWYIQEDHAILIDSKLPQRGQQLHTAHMLAHLRLGHGSTAGRHAFEARHELEASQLCTEWMIPPVKLANLLEGVTTDAVQIAGYLGVSVTTFAHGMASVSRDYWRRVRALTNRRIRWPSEIDRATASRCVILDTWPLGLRGTGTATALLPTSFTSSVPSSPGQPMRALTSRPACADIRRTGTRLPASLQQSRETAAMA